MLPLSGIQFGVGRAFIPHAYAEQGPEGVERVEPPVKAEGELVQVSLEVLGANPMMTATKPAFQVGKYKVHYRQIFFRDLWVIRLNHGKVLVALFGQGSVAGSRIGHDNRTGVHHGFNKATKRLGRPVIKDTHSQPTRIAPASPHGLVALLCGSRADLNGSDNEGLVRVDAPAFTTGSTAHPSLVNLDMVSPTDTPDLVPVRADHTSPKLVQNLERRLIAGQAKLPLELDSRQPRRQAGYEISTPEPRRERRVGALHDCASGQGGVLPASLTAQHTRPSVKSVGFTLNAAQRANEALLPTCLFQIGGTGQVIREQLLKLRQRLREGQIGTFMNIVHLLTLLETTNDRLSSTSRCGCQPDRHEKNYDRRWPILRDVPAAVRFISYEPAIGPLNIGGWQEKVPDWIICGGESGKETRYMDPSWAESLKAQCENFGIAFFMKQMTGKKPIPDHLLLRQFPEAA
jgi:hypothetical protein